ncbi:hypothetical protein SAMN05421595_1486 [Austwickia chelonae]|uniref:Uncharacterized protein n=1 Tax=Austwickia chelonae NBRC 105200 TaxID=1184607 RepID=K6V5Z8_9MICO|nr:hypothetical protein [Austwickia chelonae]GAB77648.1 hypothetical protein AUCHE_05_05630 [Austwickia chelonae NBRC 105200]SEW14899.1 hypothetical protein SAMN05421595_1486 [Austwickia chelonae]
MSVIDRVRIENAVQRYDFALDLYGVSGKQRRGLRRELRGNLREAATHGGAREAIHGIGSPEQLARESAHAIRDPRRPAWSQGLSAAALAVAIYWTVVFYTAFTWMDAVIATGVEHEVVGRVSFLPGIEYRAQHTATSFSGGLTTSGTFALISLGIFLVVLALAGRLWRPLRRASS